MSNGVSGKRGSVSFNSEIGDSRIDNGGYEDKVCIIVPEKEAIAFYKKSKISEGFVKGNSNLFNREANQVIKDEIDRSLRGIFRDFIDKADWGNALAVLEENSKLLNELRVKQLITTAIRCEQLNELMRNLDILLCKEKSGLSLDIIFWQAVSSIVFVEDFDAISLCKQLFAFLGKGGIDSFFSLEDEQLNMRLIEVLRGIKEFEAIVDDIEGYDWSGKNFRGCHQDMIDNNKECGEKLKKQLKEDVLRKIGFFKFLNMLVQDKHYDWSAVYQKFAFEREFIKEGVMVVQNQLIGIFEAFIRLFKVNEEYLGMDFNGKSQQDVIDLIKQFFLTPDMAGNTLLHEMMRHLDLTNFNLLLGVFDGLKLSKNDILGILKKENKNGIAVIKLLWNRISSKKEAVDEFWTLLQKHEIDDKTIALSERIEAE